MKAIFIVVIITHLAFSQVSKATIQEELVGTWKLISIDNIFPDGNRQSPYGKDPKGLLNIDMNGNYSIQIYKNVRPKVASGDKNKATTEEYLAIVQGSNSHFGTLSINDLDKTLIFKIAYASFPNWEGTIQKRSFEYNNDTIKYIVTNTTQGGESFIAEVVWQKIK